MSYEPVIKKDEPTTIAYCAACNGSVLCCIEKYIPDDERKEIERLSSQGFKILSLPLFKALNMEECLC